MTEQQHPDVLALQASLPAPGWTVLDRARDQRFTGELRARTDDDIEFRVYVDRGEVYCAERSTDPTLGTRLVEAGAINAAQLDYGMLRIGDIEHLGRLFDRVPSINRDAVFVLNELMTDETMRSMAARSITAVDATPYRHHPSGMHRWTTLDLSRTPAPWGDVPELSLPAPAPDARPVSVEEPAPAPTVAPRSRTAPADAAQQATPKRDRPEAPPDATSDLFLDDVVEWDEPALLVGTAAATTGAVAHESRFTTSPPLGTGDWVDDLGPDGVADAPVAPARRAKLPPAHVPPVEQFEVIWPSGEIDDVTTPEPHADALAPRLEDHGPGTPPEDDADADTEPRDDTDTEPRDDTDDEPHVTPDDEPHVTADDEPRAAERLGAATDETADDRTEPDDALAVRRAVATIDTGSLAVRRRLAFRGEDLPTPPGRLIVGRDHHTAWRNGSGRPTGSVFDAQPAEVVTEPDEPSSTPDDQERRAGALRRLIGSLLKTDD